MTFWGMMFFPDANSPLLEQMIFFHNHTMIILLLIMSLITYLMTNMLINKYFCNSLIENQDLEIIWTLLPMILLLIIAMPSIRLLYLLEENFNNNLTIKIMGHQWYWSYFYPEFNIQFDSYMLPTNLKFSNSFRLLEVDNRLILPINLYCRLLITSFDVIHAWTLPSLGLKIDAVPGRLNQLMMFSSNPKLLFGQCSEICGSNHSFMPITLELTSIKNFYLWIKNF